MTIQLSRVPEVLDLSKRVAEASRAASSGAHDRYKAEALLRAVSELNTFKIQLELDMVLLAVRLGVVEDENTLDRGEVFDKLWQYSQNKED